MPNPTSHSIPLPHQPHSLSHSNPTPASIPSPPLPPSLSALFPHSSPSLQVVMVRPCPRLMGMKARRCLTDTKV